MGFLLISMQQPGESTLSDIRGHDTPALPRRGWDMGQGMCQTTGFLLTFLGMASINNLVAISIYRYLVISYAKV